MLYNAESVKTPQAKRRAIKRTIKGYIFIGGPILGMLLFTFIPMIMSLYISFFGDVNNSLEDMTFVGFANYADLMSGMRAEEFWNAMLNTLYYCVSVPIVLIIALFIAVLINQNVKGKRFFRTIFFIPYVCSTVATSIVWGWIFNTTYGAVNTTLKVFGLQPVEWLSDNNFMPLMIFIATWSGIGNPVILFQAALGLVNQSHIEAAQIDGANRWTIFRKITLPAISPTTFYLLVMHIIGALQVMASVQILGDIAQSVSTEKKTTAVLYMWKLFETTQNGYGWGSACAWILTVIIMVITVINFKLSDKWVHYD